MFAVLGVLVLLATGAGLFAVQRLQGNIRTQDLTPLIGPSRPAVPTPDPDGGRPIDVLIMGSDSREGANGFVGGKKDGARSDTTLLVHIAADRSWAVGASIPRDSVVALPDCTNVDGAVVPGSVRIFNDAFTTGGPACTVKAVESLTGIRVDHYVVVDFAGFKDVVDALGTVSICLSEPVEDPKHHISLPAGRSRVDGTTALAYVRERYKIGDGGDLGRIDRQQAFLSSVLQQATSAGTLANPVRLYAFLDAATKSLTMDPELSALGTLTGFARDIEKVGLTNIRFLTVPNGPDPADTNRLVWLPSASRLWTALRTDTPLAVSGPGATRPSRTPTPTDQTPTPPATATPTDGSPTPTASPSRRPVVLTDVKSRTADTNICTP